MKKIYLLLLLFLFGCSQAGFEEFQTGKEVYEARCSACHAPDFKGRVGPSIDSNSPSAKMPDTYWIQTITKGKGSMPAVRLNEKEVQLVIEYIKSSY